MNGPLHSDVIARVHSTVNTWNANAEPATETEATNKNKNNKKTIREMPLK